MALTAKKTDTSAEFESRLHERLYEANPNFDHTQVDLTAFCPPRAKIDCLTISKREGIPFSDVRSLQQQLTGKVARPNNQQRIATIHDPSNADLRYLAKHYADAEITMIEIAVDVYLPQWSNDLYLLRGLKLQLRHCLAPQRHKNFIEPERKFFNLQNGYYSPDVISDKDSAPTTIKYFTRSRDHSLKLYLKTRDQDRSLTRPFLRTELRMDTPMWAGLGKASDFCDFGRNLRKYCSDVFSIGKSFNLDDIAGTKWAKYGASWDLKGNKKLQVRPNSSANKMFGDALSELGRGIVRATSR